ncbi:DUF6159 family protein [Streptacidiphilus sp. N1-12]|uniref:DUF6159 family protein n=2 Tax=Streptacidiphilus alkalitolerans TaxID=3342712 RepID=A0ABV6VDE9_9ACTN
MARRKGAIRVAWKVYRLRPSLAVVPAVGLLCLLAAVGVLLLAAQGICRTVADGHGLSVRQLWPAAAFYPLFTTVSVCFRAALLKAVDGVLRREPLPLRAVFAATARRLPVYALWGLVAPAVDLLEGLLGAQGVGLVLEALLDFSWWTISYFMLPVLVVEGLGPVAAGRRSIRLSLPALGERVAGAFLLQLLTLVLVVLPGIVALIYGAESGSTAVLLLSLGLAVGWGVLVTVLLTTVNGAFRMVLYHRALRALPAGPKAEPQQAGAAPLPV